MFQAAVRVLRWGVLDLNAGIAARMWFGALFGPVLIVAGGTLIGTRADYGPRVLTIGIVVTVIGLTYVVVTRVRAARTRNAEARARHDQFD